MKQMQATVRGRVQGVGFRAFAQREAVRLGLAGWVANRADGSVEVVAEGPEDALDRLVRWLHRGPPAAHVNTVDVRRGEATGEFRDFHVRH